METSAKPVALWSVPRSLSTAFERVFVERDDFKVFHEPFSMAYYCSSERRSERFAGHSLPENRHESVLEKILSTGRPTFFKDMAYHTTGFMETGLVENFSNTFLIRQPAQVLLSLQRMWQDFTIEEAGYEQLYRLYNLAVEAGQSPVVVDAFDLSTRTQAMISAYCEALGIPHRPEALSWEPEEIAEWKVWEGWHDDAQNSARIEEIPHEEPELPEELRAAYEHCLPYYQALRAERLRPAQA